MWPDGVNAGDDQIIRNSICHRWRSHSIFCVKLDAMIAVGVVITGVNHTGAAIETEAKTRAIIREPGAGRNLHTIKAGSGAVVAHSWGSHRKGPRDTSGFLDTAARPIVVVIPIAIATLVQEDSIVVVLHIVNKRRGGCTGTGWIGGGWNGRIGRRQSRRVSRGQDHSR